MADQPSRGALAMVEIVRLVVVIVFTAAGFGVASTVNDTLDLNEPEQTRLVMAVLGALVGYLAGGGLGRLLVRGVDRAQERLRRVDAGVLVAAVVGAGVAATLGFLLLWPVLLFPGKIFTVPIALGAVAVLAYGGGRIGAGRAGDLGRFVGVRGRLEVSSPSRGAGVKLVDSSAFIDGRIVEVARAGFIEGTLVVPQFIVLEMQALADAQERRKRDAGRRGLDSLHIIQSEGLVAVEITEEDPPGIQDVDAKLAELARQRDAAIVTVDGNLARVAEISGMRVLNLHVLADAMRSPVVPGDRVTVPITKEGREPGQGVGYLGDGTMVVVEKAVDRVGEKIDVDITSIMQTTRGRMLFAQISDEDV